MTLTWGNLTSPKLRSSWAGNPKLLWRMDCQEWWRISGAASLGTTKRAAVLSQSDDDADEGWRKQELPNHQSITFSTIFCTRLFLHAAGRSGLDEEATNSMHLTPSYLLPQVVWKWHFNVLGIGRGDYLQILSSAQCHIVISSTGHKQSITPLDASSIFNTLSREFAKYLESVVDEGILKWYCPSLQG